MTIQSMVAQTALPLKWVIVSDGSTDRTDEIVTSHAAKHDWIQLVRLADRQERDFAGKVRAFNAGQAAVKELCYDVIACLDADITFNEDYFAFLLEKLTTEDQLGLVGTPFVEQSGTTYDYRFVNIEHVSGACQVFRRECFAAIGGYVPVKGGAIDSIAVVTARMKGWKTRTFTEKVCMHHREMGTAQRAAWKARFKFGAKDYAMGNHPLWELFRVAYQMTKSPFVLGGITLGAGYLWASLRVPQRPVSKELVAFYQAEQLHRLKRFFGGGRASSEAREPSTTP
jgi:glycosyltransferase involved in cell wall biosynthesis